MAKHNHIISCLINHSTIIIIIIIIIVVVVAVIFYDYPQFIL